MVNALKTAIEKVRELPQERQEYAAQILERIAESSGSYRVPRGHRKEVLKGLRQSKQKKFASAAAVKKALHTKWA
ncbi:MAG: hypothetical protein AAB790_02895 [Patescibacteria group bacterium]